MKEEMEGLREELKVEEIHVEQQEQQQQEQQSTRVKDMTAYFEEEAKRQETRDMGYALREKLKENMVMKEDEYSETMIPMDQVLKSEYREEYKEKSLVKSRESKIKNKKSRLYAKDQVARGFDAMAAQDFRDRDTRAKLRRSVPKEQRMELKTTELNALSMLSSLKNGEDQTADFEALVEKYTGTTKDGTQKTPAQKKEDRFAIISDLANELMSRQFQENFNIFDDAQLSANREELERNSRQLSVFTELLKQNPDFMETLKTKERDSDELAGGQVAARLEKQIERLRAVDDVYRIRKLIVTNPYYRTHYNDELSMNAEQNDHPQKKYLSKLLRTQFYLGKNLQKAMGADENIVYADTFLTANTSYMKNFENQVKQISKSSEDYDRKNVDQMLIAMEHEKDCMPPEDLLFDLDTVSSIKPKNMARVVGSCPGKDKSKYALEVLEPKEPTPEEKAFEEKLSEITKKVGTHTISVRSEKLHNFVGGDVLNRQTTNIKGTFCDTMTYEERLEMVENLMYSHTMKDPSEKEKAMADDLFLNAYGKYMGLMHQKMKMTCHILGDKMEHLRPEDWLRVMSNPKMSDLMITNIGVSSNMDCELPYEFMKKYSDLPVEHLKDFDLLSKGTSSIAFPADVFRSKVIYTLASRPAASPLENKLAQERDEAKEAYDALVEAHATKEEIDAAYAKWDEARKKCSAASELYTASVYKDPEDFIKMKKLTKYVVKDENNKDDKGTVVDEKAQIKEDIISENEMYRGNMLLTGYLSFKKSPYWEYSTTSKEGQAAYQKKCDDLGYIKLEMDPKKYNTKNSKSTVRQKVEQYYGYKNKAEEYGLGESETALQDIALMHEVWKDLGYPENEWNDMIHKIEERPKPVKRRRK